MIWRDAVVGIARDGSRYDHLKDAVITTDETFSREGRAAAEAKAAAVAVEAAATTKAAPIGDQPPASAKPPRPPSIAEMVATSLRRVRGGK